MDAFKTHLVAKGFSANTVQAYTTAVAQLGEKLGEKLGSPPGSAPASETPPGSAPVPSPALTDEALLAHKDWLASNYAPKTVNLRITGINAYLDFIGYEGMRLKSLRVQQKPFLDCVISQGEYEHLRDSLLADGNLFWYYVVRFLACTGARVSELRMFTAESVRAGYLDLISKGQKLRRIYIPSKLQRNAMGWLRDMGRTSGYIFAQDGAAKPMTARGIAVGLKRIAVRYDVDPEVVYPHSFRHRFAKNFLERNPDISLLADLMGHENLETTRVYLRRTSAEQRCAVDEAVTW